MNKVAELKERNIIIRLSDSDCEKLICRCGRAGLRIGELVGYGKRTGDFESVDRRT